MSNKKKINMGFILDSFDFTKPLKSIKNVATYLNIMNRPVGVVTKNYDHIRRTLYEKIGSHNHDFDGYGTPIGQLADVELNEQTTPWFYLDEKKNNTTNYIDYLNNHYFKGDGITHNFDDYIKDIKIDSQVGVIREYNFRDNYSEYQTNPNKNDDTRLGQINNEYLGQLLRIKELKETENSNKSITSNLYKLFGVSGKFGVDNGVSSTFDNRPRTQNELLGHVIPWSTTDHNYDSNVVAGGGEGNLSKIQSIFNLASKKDLSLIYTDDAKITEPSSLYYPFGNFYSNTYSLGLLSSTNEKTKQFISKSMLGYDLMNDTPYYDLSDHSKNEDIKSIKKYYVGNGTRGTNYIDAMSGTDVEFIKYNKTIKDKDGNEVVKEEVVRMSFPDMGNDSLWSTRALYTYAEAEGNKTPDDAMNLFETFNLGVEYGKHIVYNQAITSEKQDIVHYTNKRFQEGKYKTLISRFHTDEIGLEGSRGNRDLTSTAISKYGMSHGRNLLKVTPTNEHGYNNPYCRTWTYHHQYSTLKDVIRPFDRTVNKIEESGVEYYRTKDGSSNLSKYGVKHSNGLIRITPTKDDIDSNDKTYGIKRCMFSIENLAWKGEKDFFVGHEDQKGPLGGRIMWFPPYDLNFSESVGVNWNANNFIGRGESIYTYTNTERSGTLSFKILIDHPSIVHQWSGEVKGGDGIGDVDDIHSNEQQLLRFFAGCELLKVAKPKEDVKPKEPVIEVKPKTPITVPQEMDELVFYVFYPNNYSGVDDEADGVVKPMEYLINGVGASKVLVNGKIVDNPTQLDKRLYGYEMGNAKGISNMDSTTVTNSTQPMFDNIAYQYCKTNKVGKPNYWAYRCDKVYENQVLHTFNGDTRYNYYDSKNFGLNTTGGYLKLTSVHTNDEELVNKGRLFSFADVFCAIQPEGKNVLTATTHYDNEQVNIITELLGLNQKENRIVGINVQGFASSHGYQKSNDVLGKNRAKSVKDWLKKCHMTKFSSALFTYSTNEIGEQLSNYDSNSFLAKAWRCSRVAIKFRKDSIVNKSEEKGKDNITWADNKAQNEINNARNVVEMTDARNGEEANLAYSKAYGVDMNTMQKNAVVNQTELNRSNADVEAMKADKTGNATNMQGEYQNGYGKEYEFFSMLSTEKPFLHSKIVDKLQYFDPAFHSITPEGFQSRLTFLHQCTRQGNTAAATDVNNKNRTANNLAFGRPPICVLRIGDFYNTKIIMESLQISYDDTTWDLNDEGIGVMPMMANVTIGFKFLGGSDLTGPINRLQNSLSFNYYANTGVYDNRAESVEYNDEGEIINFNYK